MPWSRAVVAHPFFKLIDLTSSHTRALKAPHVSPLKSNKDLPNFDDVSEADAVTRDPSSASRTSPLDRGHVLIITISSFTFFSAARRVAKSVRTCFYNIYKGRCNRTAVP